MRPAVVLAERVMRLRERTPPDPSETVGGLSEVFSHPLFTEGTEQERERIMDASARSRYDDELAFPWENYFGHPIKQWVGTDVLDLGCFTGGRAVAWREGYRLEHVSGTDVDQVFIDAAERFARSKRVEADFRVGAGEAIPWPDNSFDTILSFDVFEHVRDVEATLAECRRVLRPGGHLLVVFPSYFQPIEHHLSLATTVPGLQYLFGGPTLIDAYRSMLHKRGASANWYGRGEMEGWERGNTINGMTDRRFKQLLDGWEVVEHPCLPIGAVGRRTANGKGKLVARVAGPLTRIPLVREAAVHRIVYVLHAG